MEVSELRQRLIMIEAWAGQLKRTEGAAPSPSVKQALDVYDTSMKGAIRTMLQQIDAAPAGQIDVGGLVQQLDGKIDNFLKVAADCPAMQMFKSKPGAPAVQP